MRVGPDMSVMGTGQICTRHCAPAGQDRALGTDPPSSPHRVPPADTVPPSPPIQVRESQLAAFREEAKSRKKVLLKLGHIDEEGGCGKRGNEYVGECGRYQESCETACAISIEAH